MKNEPIRILILSCSARKFPAEKLCAIDRYQSPAFAVVRKWLRENPKERNPRTKILILSAYYGLITAGTPTVFYDERLTGDNFRSKQIKFNRWAFELGELLFSDKRIERVFCHLPKIYASAIDDFLESLAETSPVEFAQGPPGIKLRQLKNWLEN